MKRNIHSWNFICKFINSYNDGDIVTRKEMREAFVLAKYGINSEVFIRSTLDGYKRLLTRIGVLEDVSRGKYKKLHSIPSTLTSTGARRIATELPNWKDWFMTIEDRLDSYEKSIPRV
jgi:hypothetical protein